MPWTVNVNNSTICTWVLKEREKEKEGRRKERKERKKERKGEKREGERKRREGNERKKSHMKFYFKAETSVRNSS